MTIRIPSEIFELKTLLEPTHDLPEWQPSGLVNNFPGAPAAPADGGGAQPGGDGGNAGGDAGGQAGGAQPGAAAGDGGGAAGAAAADPRVLEQMQSQMEQFGGVIGQMAEYMPALQTFAQQQQQQAAGPAEPTLEDLAAQFFGTGEPIGQQDQGQQQFDQFGNPVQPQGQPQGQQQPPAGMDPAAFAEAVRNAVRQEVAPLQQREQQREWDALYQEIPALANPETARPYAARVWQAAQLFGRDQAEAERLTQSAGFARFVYMSTVGEQAARGETPAGSGELPNPIENGGGASPGGEQVDEGDRIVNAGGASGSYFG